VTAPRHQILRQILEVTVPDHEAAWRLQSELGRIHAERIGALLDRCCTELGAPDRVQRIESLVVDLGRIDPDDLEHDLLEKLGPLLREALAARIREADEQTALRGEDPEVISRLELVAFFATTGNLPWWADTTRPRLLDEALGLLLQRAARPLAALVRALERERGALRRIVRSSGDARLWSLFDALVASSRLSLPERPAELGALLGAHRAITGATPSGFKAQVWTGALQTACLSEIPSDGPVGFWRDALARIALEAGVTFRALVSGLPAALGQSPSTWPGALGAVEQSRAVLVTEEPRAARRALVSGLPAALGQSPSTWPGALGAVEQSRAELVTEEPRAAREDRPVDPAEAGGIDVKRAGPAERRRALPRIPEEEPRIELAYADSDDAYVENAGIVVLWPFLGHLFERLGLLADTKLRDRRALHRAAGLLQHLATGGLEPAEHQLPLIRVLCGMETTEVFDFGPPITEAEAEECTNLLRSAIASAPILNEMSIEGFRGSFLIRKGAIGARDDTWLLRVERATHDVVLDRCPWGMSWVKLPWMEAPLCVEW
jgi:hypothetical protein